MGYAVDRGWPTGESKTLSISGQLILNYAGGTYVETDPSDYAGCSIPYDSGWILADTFAPFTLHCVGGPEFTGGHSIALSAFGAEFSIITHGVDRDHDPVGDPLPYDPLESHYAWRTALYHNGEIVQHYDDPADRGLTSTTPITVTGDFSVSFAVEKWVYELDYYDGSGNSGGVGARPLDSHSGKLFVVWKIVSDLTSIFAGSTRTIPKESVTSPAFQFGLSNPAEISGVWFLSSTFYDYFNVSATTDTRGKAGQIYDLLPEAEGKDAIKYGQALSEVRFGSTDGPVAIYTSLNQWLSSPSDNCGTPVSSGKKLRFYSAGGEKNSLVFRQPTNGIVTVNEGYNSDYAYNWTGKQLSSINVNGTIRDWEKTLFNFPVRMNPDIVRCDDLEFNVPLDYNFSGTQVLSFSTLVEHEVGFAGYPAYGGIPPYPMVLQYGPEWGSLKVEHIASLVVEDFKRSGSGINDWQGSGTRTLESDNLRVDAGTGNFIAKTLKSDYRDITDDPVAWWAAHRNNLSALVGTERTLAKEWGDLTQAFYRIGRKMLETSDEFNWSSYRYAYLKAKASSPCQVVMVVTYTEYEFTDAPDNGFSHDYTIDYTVNLGTMANEVEIDLAAPATNTFYAAGYQQKLRYIRHITISIPDGITTNFYSITLKHKLNPKIEVHHGESDSGVITGIVDGKHGLFLSTGTNRYSGNDNDSRWGWPERRLMVSPYGGYFSQTIRELSTEIFLQAGWKASELNSPTHGRPNYASDLKEAFNAESGGTLLSVRHFGIAEFSSNMTENIRMFFNVGNAIQPLVIDPDTELPASTDVFLEGSLFDGDTVNQTDSAHSDAKGGVQLQMTRGEFYRIYTNQELATPYTFEGGSERGTLDFPSIAGKDVASTDTGSPWICTSSDLEAYVAIIKDGALQIAKIRGAETDFQFFHVATGLNNPVIAKHEKRTDYPLYIAGHIDGPPKKILLLKNTEYGGSGLWKTKVVATGSQGFIQIEESLNLLFVSYFRDGNFYLKKSSDEGVTWLKWGSSGTDECLVKAGVTEQHFTFDLLSTKDRTFIGVYTDGSGVLQTLKSTDLGDTWA